MKFCIDAPVFEKFPDLVVAVPIIMGFDNTKGHEQALVFLRKTEQALRASMMLEDFQKDPRVTAYLDAFGNFGVDPEKFLPAHVALARRVLEGKDLPDINPLVDVYNALSIKYLTPFGGEDLDTLYGDFVLKFAKGGEQWIPIGGGKPKPAVTGELVWGDDFDLSTRALNWRQCDRTKLTETSKNGYFVMDGFTQINRDNITKAADEFIALAIKHFGGKATIYWLDKDHPVAEVPFSTKKQTKIAKLDSPTGSGRSSPHQVKLVAKRTGVSKQPLLFSAHTFRGQIQSLFIEILYQLNIKDVIPDVEISDAPLHGEYTTNVAMRLTKVLKKPPMEIALQVKEALEIQKTQDTQEPHDQDIHQEDQTETAKIAGNIILQAIDRVEVVPPGFINIFLTEAILSSQLNRVLEEKKSYGSARTSNLKSRISSRKVMVEFTDPNPFKEFHIGHLYSNAVGESLCRLLEASGCEVKRADYFGEVGMHVAKAIWGMRKQLSNTTNNTNTTRFAGASARRANFTNIEALPLPERVKWMGQSYAMGAKAFEEVPEAADEMKRLNKLIFIAAQELLEEKTGKKPMVDYHKGETIDAAELLDIKVLFGNGRQWSLDYFETIYKRLGTKFDYYYPESEVAEYGVKLVTDHIGTVFEKSDGAVVYHGESEGLHTRVFINKLGLPTYEAKELGLNDKKYKDWPFDASIIVTGKEITEYFHVLLSAMGKVIPDVAAKTRHIGHGMVRLPAGKMTSRSGNVITGESLLDSVKQKIYDILDQSESKKSESTESTSSSEIRFAPYLQTEKDAIAEAAAVSAVKYSLLKVALPSDITFDLDKSVSFEGDSGPYLLYTYARCKSVLRKAEELRIKNKEIHLHSPCLAGGRAFSILHSISLNLEEHALARLILYYPDVVAAASADLAPSRLCTYLYDVASAFNLFYAKHTILGGAENELRASGLELREENEKKAYPNFETQTSNLPQSALRIALTAATAQVLANGLALLGISTVERM